MNPRGSRPRSPPGPRPEIDSPPGRERRARRIGLAVSAALHILLIAVYPLFVGFPALDRPSSDRPDVALTPEGIEVIDIVEIQTEDPAAPEPPEIEPEPEETTPEPEPPQPAEPADPPDTPAGTVEDEDGPAIAERLQPRMVDPRLWAPVAEVYLELTEEERAQILIDGMIRTFNDSLAVAQALEGNPGDWTYTDDEGRTWGLAPGRLYLGDYSVPLPAIEMPPTRLIEDQIQRQWIMSDLIRGQAAAAIRDTWTQRARFIRERLEAERNGTAPETPVPPRRDESVGSR